MILSQELKKYRDCWSLPQYRDYSPGEQWAPLFRDAAQPAPGQKAIDLGCGVGKGGKALAEMGLAVTYLDLENYAGLEPFIAQPLWEPIPGVYDFGYCTDVLEHLPQEFTMLAVRNMLGCCGSVFFSISFIEDNFGGYIGQSLHLTVRPFTWWRDRLSEMGRLLDARDLLEEGVFHVAR